MRELFASEIQAIIDKNAELKKANQELVQALREAADDIENLTALTERTDKIASMHRAIADKWEMK